MSERESVGRRELGSVDLSSHGQNLELIHNSARTYTMSEAEPSMTASAARVPRNDELETGSRKSDQGVRYVGMGKPKDRRVEQLRRSRASSQYSDATSETCTYTAYCFTPATYRIGPCVDIL